MRGRPPVSVHRRRFSDWLTPLADPWILAALGLALAARLVFAVAVPSGSFNIRRYIEPAKDMMAGRWLSDRIVEDLPGAPLFFALSMLVVGENVSTLAVLQHALGMLTLALVVAAAWRCAGPAAGRAAAWLLAVQLLLPYQECFMLSESVAQFFLAAWLLLTLELRRADPPRLRWWALAGAAAGLAALTRGELLVLGPLTAGALALPLRGRPHRWRWLAAFAAWAALIGGWTLHNAIAGFPGFSAHGPISLSDSTSDLIRYDLPDQALAKGILREEYAKCARRPGCNGPIGTMERLQREHGYTLLQAETAIARISREAIVTQPTKFMPRFLNNFRAYLLPIPWMEDDRVNPADPLARLEAEAAGWRRVLWGFIKAFGQHLGWLPMGLAALYFPLLLLAPRERVWESLLMAAAFLSVGAFASLFRTVARTQAQLFLPLALVGGFTAAKLAALARKRWPPH